VDKSTDTGTGNGWALIMVFRFEVTLSG
jgi:hypothetical protein